MRSITTAGRLTRTVYMKVHASSATHTSSTSPPHRAPGRSSGPGRSVATRRSVRRVRGKGWPISRGRTSVLGLPSRCRPLWDSSGALRPEIPVTSRRGEREVRKIRERDSVLRRAPRTPARPGIELTATETRPVVLPAPARSRPRSSCPGGRSACPTWPSAEPPGRGRAPFVLVAGVAEIRRGVAPVRNLTYQCAVDIPKQAQGDRGPAVSDGVGDEFAHDQL